MATILMIDDDPDVVAAIRALLEGHGHHFHSAENGEVGLRRVVEVNPDLIILDVMMTRYTEGFNVARTLREPSPDSPYAANRNVPILVFTAIHKTTPHRFGPDEGYLPVDAFLDKSTPTDQLLATVEALLATAGAAR